MSSCVHTQGSDGNLVDQNEFTMCYCHYCTDAASVIMCMFLEWVWMTVLRHHTCLCGVMIDASRVDGVRLINVSFCSVAVVPITTATGGFQRNFLFGIMSLKLGNQILNSVLCNTLNQSYSVIVVCSIYEDKF